MLSDVDNNITRTQKLLSAREKLKHFRASRSLTGTSFTASAAASTSPPFSIYSSPHLSTLALSPTDTVKFMIPPREPMSERNIDDSDRTEVNELNNDRTRRVDGANLNSLHHASDIWSANSGSCHRQSYTSSGTASDTFALDLPSVRSSYSDSAGSPSELTISLGTVTAPATPVTESPDVSPCSEESESIALARMATFSLGSKSPPSNPRKTSLLPALNLRGPSSSHPTRSANVLAPTSFRSSNLPANFTPTTLDLSAALSRKSTTANGSLTLQPSPPIPKRHSHNRSESISIPNCKLSSRPPGVSPPSVFSQSSPSIDANGVTSRLNGPIKGKRLKFEPSGRGAEADKEKDDLRRRALDELTGASRIKEMRQNEITLPSFDDDDDDDDMIRSSNSLRPTITPNSYSSFAFTSTSSFSLSDSNSVYPPLCSAFDPSDSMTCFPHFNADSKGNERANGVDNVSTQLPTVVLGSGLAVLEEEDENDDAQHERVVPGDERANLDRYQPSSESLGTVLSSASPSPLKDLHLVTSAASSPATGRRSHSDGEKMIALPTTPRLHIPDTHRKDYGKIGRGRPRPLPETDMVPPLMPMTPMSAHCEVTSSSPSSPNLPRLATRTVRRGSSISYKKDTEGGSGSSRDWSVPAHPSYSPPNSEATISASPRAREPSSQHRIATRPCPRPRSIVGLGFGSTSGRVLGEVDEEDENDDDKYSASDMTGAPFTPEHGFREDCVSVDRRIMPLRENVMEPCWPEFSLHGSGNQDELISCDRLEGMTELVALRDDVDLWRNRCRNLEVQLEAELREAGHLRERAMKLSNHPLSLPSDRPQNQAFISDGQEAPHSKLLLDLREQVVGLTSALQTERREKKEVLRWAKELQMRIDSAKIVVDSSDLFPSGHKVRPISPVPSPRKCLDDWRSGIQPLDSQPEIINSDTNFNRLKKWGFPALDSSRYEKSSFGRDSFLGLLDTPTAESSPRFKWPSALAEVPDFDLPPFVIDERNYDVSTHPTSHVALVRDWKMDKTSHTGPTMKTSSFSFTSGFLPTPPLVPTISDGFPTTLSLSPGQPVTFSKTQDMDTAEASLHDERPQNPTSSTSDVRHMCRRCTGDIIEL